MKPFSLHIDRNDQRVLVLALIYFAAVYGGSLLAFRDIQATAILPATGIGLAMMFMYGKRIWPAIITGSFVGHAWSFYAFNGDLTWSGVLGSMLLAVGSVMEVMLGYGLLREFFNEKDLFYRAGDTFKFIGIALVTGLAGATMGTLFLGVTDQLQAHVLLSWLLWVLADMVGILLFTPFILSWSRRFIFQWNRPIAMEVTVFALCLISVLVLSSVPYFSPIIGKSFPYLVIPFFLWLAFRFNLQLSISGILLVSLLSVVFTLEGRGPFVMESDHHSLLMLQIFIGVFCISTIVLTATVQERKEAQKSVELFNERLEATVAERTKELHEEIRIRKTAEQNTKVTNKQLRKTNQELDSFVYSVSHDLRAPISSVLGLLNLAKSEKDQKMLQKYLDMMSKSVTQQDLFIKDILNLSRNSRLDLNRNEILFEEMITDIFDQLRYIDHQEVSKVVNVVQKKPFYSDDSRLKVVFNNLISNAIRYHNGKKPKVKVDVTIKPKYAYISIEDNGIGISNEHLNNVFKMFYRATDTNHGSGLGLYIVKETVEKLKGTVKILSKVNKGTTVMLQIPSL
ncbi:MAG: MASE1 domain-containing protein [Cyclobacteriaceae bacterium]|nr:MASE1 domain-containing protein [Cyclobacteriaceae bacterium]